MSALALTVMVLVCGFVWGGFALLLVRAARREKGKRRAEEGAQEAAQEGAERARASR